MPATYHERLSALDQSFLALETPNASMHVALTAIFEPGPLLTAQGGIDIDAIRRHIAARLPLTPRYRQRLLFTPMLGDAVWVDDDAFDLTFHVRHASLPRPGGERQLQRRCAEILERPLDRRRPLWEVWVIEGLSGDRFAMLCKVHHCMVDGIAGVDILAALLDTVPSEVVEPAEPWAPRPMPSQREVLAAELRRRARASIGLMRGMRDALRAPRQTRRDLGARATAFFRLLGHLGRAPSTPFNLPIGPHRRIDWLSFELATIKAVRTAFGGTINDVVLSTVAGAVGKFLARRRVRLDGEFRAVVPVSVRGTDERGVPGNRVSVWLTTLPVGERDARRCLATVSRMTAQLKDSRQAAGAEVLTQVAEWTTANVINLAAQFINGTHRFNLIVTNVPGPPVPFYLLGARMVAAYPHLPLFENQGLGIALFSYAGNLYWGVGADWNQMPDLHEFMADLAESFAELCAVARVDGLQPEARRSAAVPRATPLTVRRGSVRPTSATPVKTRGTGARTRAGSAADGLRRAAPVPRLDTGRASRSTAQPGGQR
jgi:WS/DGAT/MGAT family acyltransferase